MKFRIVLALTLTMLACSGPAPSRSIHGAVYNPPSNQGWSILPIGAGGLFTGISFANDGTKYARNNTYGAHYYNPTTPNCGNASRTGCWQQCLTKTGLNDALAIVANGDVGADEIQTYALDGAKVYMLWFGYFWYSADHCATWVRETNFPVQSFAPNGIGGTNGPWIAVDPQNPDVVWAGTLGNGIYSTNNATAGASATWTQKSTATVPAGTGAGVMVAIDPNSPVVSSKKQIIYAAVNGVGMYRSADAGANWTKISGAGTGTTGLTTFTRMHVSFDGNVWVTAASGSTPVWSYIGSTWTNQTMNCGTSCVAAVPDPSTAGRVIAIGGSAGNIGVTVNNGGAWTAAFLANAGATTAGCGDIALVATDIPWLCNSAELVNGLTTTDASFDPSTSNSFYIAQGIAIWNANPPNTASNFSWTSISAATENLVGNQVIQAPGCSRPIATAWDRAAFYSPSDTLYPSSISANSGVAIVFGFGADWASANNGTLVGLFQSNNNPRDFSGISTDCGQTWAPFGTTPTVSSNVTFVGSGTVNLTVPTGLSLTNGQFVVVYHAPVTGNYDDMFGTISSYNSGTGALAITVTTAHGGGTFPQNTLRVHTMPPVVGGLVIGGSVAASSSTNIVWFPSSFGNTDAPRPYYTTDGGLTWALCSFPASVPTTGNTGWSAGLYTSNPQIVAADRVNANTFYAYNINVNNTGADGVYKSVDGGANWVKVSTGTVLTNANGPSRMRTVPGNAGHIFLVSSANGSFPRFSNDGGATWTDLTDSAGGLAIDNTLGIGIGATYPGQSYPAIFVSGERNNVWGAWRATNFNPATAAGSWTNMGGGYPNDSFDIPRWVEGDMNNVGRLYYSFSGSGFARGQFN